MCYDAQAVMGPVFRSSAWLSEPGINDRMWPILFSIASMSGSSFPAWLRLHLIRLADAGDGPVEVEVT